MSEIKAKDIRYCPGCKNNYRNLKSPKCENLHEAQFQEKTMYPYSAHYEDMVTIKTYNCYVRDYITPFPRELEIKQLAK